ncbi:hypothetical protein [Bacillus cereus group sp. Bce018]|uniref:hypothetical protein n=1 Tax=Bacillus cereus group sp. Bce018 TaxID=3445248 RepID=UPI003F24657B
MLKENISLKNYGGHYEASEIEPSSELVYYLCSNALEVFNSRSIESSQCECGEYMDVFRTVDTVPFDKFEELDGIVVIELHFCPHCNEWKLDFIG